jgi:hypothetical protein
MTGRAGMNRAELGRDEPGRGGVPRAGRARRFREKRKIGAAILAFSLYNHPPVQYRN